MNRRILGLLLVAWPLVSGMNPGALFFPDAHAQTEGAIFEENLIQLVPIGEVVGDGMTPVTLHLMLTDEEGLPFTEPNLRLQTTGGNLSPLEAVSPGLYRVVWIPPAVSQDRTLNINLTGRTQERERLRGAWAFPVLAPLAQQVDVSSNPERLDLARDDASTLTVTLSGGAQSSIEGADLHLNTTTGELGPPVALGEGRYSLRYLKPSETYPHFALITVADRRAPGRTYGSMVLPLEGTVTQTIEGPAGGRVLVVVGDSEQGPFELNSRGSVAAQLTVPPGISEITVVTIHEGRRTEEVVPMESTDWSRLRMIPGHRSVPADPSIEVPVRVFVVDGDGRPDGEASPVLTADHGQVTELRHEGAGIYAAMWTPPENADAGTVTLNVTLESLGQEDEIRIDLLPPRPDSLELTVSPEILDEGEQEFELEARVSDGDGAGLSGRELSVQMAGARLDSGPRDQGDGRYTSTFTARGLTAEVWVTVRSPASENPVRQMVVLPTRQRLPNDGLSSTMITVLTLDEYGYPVSNRELELEVVQGDGSLPTTSTTDEAGIAQFYYTAGREPGVVQIRIRSSGHTAAVGLLQLPVDFATDLSLPASGSENYLRQLEYWSAVIGFVRVGRAGLD